MKKHDALAEIVANNCQPIRVKHKRSGVVYWIEYDVVEACVDDFVYGAFATKTKRRRGSNYRWFNLKSVELLGD